MSEKKLTPEAKFWLKRTKQLKENRRRRFVELLGEDCPTLNKFVKNEAISPHDVKALLDKGCPPDLIAEILL